MSSLIGGYNYDVFISYRQKDNKGYRWVSEFVEALKTELESTFKEEISVYFDANPVDGLLETYDVDASLKEKLKCLVFIPIISRTYCDPKSFAWEHEFKAFVEQASHEQPGLKVRLPNGNVATRVLPVRIYDLDYSDIKLCESVLGGSLRGVDFIYAEPGVNRPLRSDEDNPHDNLNQTIYRNQINKVANSIKEIIQGMKAEPIRTESEKHQPDKITKEAREEGCEVDLKKPAGAKTIRLLSTVSFAVTLIVIISILAYPKIFKQDRLDKLRSSGGRISIAVMPFQNLTNDTVWNVWQAGIQDILIASLSNSKEFKVRQTESINNLVRGKGIVNYTSITPSVASKISRQLEANVLLYGSIKQAGNITRFDAQLIDPETEEIFKSFQIEGLYREENVFHLIDSLSMMVKNFLIISKLEKEGPDYYKQLISTSSPEAYRCFVQGRNKYMNWDYLSAIDWFTKAIAIDSNFFQVILMTSLAYGNQFEYETTFSSLYDKLYLYDEAKKWCLMAYEKMDQMSVLQKINTNWMYANFFGTPNDRIKYLKELVELDDQQVIAWFNLGNAYSDLRQYDLAIPEYTKALEIYKLWGVKPFWAHNYTYLGKMYHRTGQYRKEEKVYNKAARDFPDNPELTGWQGILALSQGDTVAAAQYFEKLKIILQSMSVSEAGILNLLAYGYSEAGVPGRAEVYFRQALSLEPDNPDRINYLAYFLIDSDRNINEGLELADKALELIPENFFYMHTKGWGLYKQGKFEEAQDILQKSWDLRRQKAVYDNDAYVHLEAAKKAVAYQKIN